ncbi:TrmH family RNA methyltransferase, partial [Aerococcus urinae]
QAQALETYNLKKHQKWGIILGNEGNGVRPEIIAASDISLYITMLGQAESLNVAIAGSIAMHHFLPN